MCGKLQFTLTFASGSRGTPAAVTDNTTTSSPKTQKSVTNAQNDGTQDRSPVCLGESAAAPVFNSGLGSPAILNQRVPSDTQECRENPIPERLPFRSSSSEAIASSLPSPSQINGILPLVKLVVCYKCINGLRVEG